MEDLAVSLSAADEAVRVVPTLSGARAPACPIEPPLRLRSGPTGVGKTELQGAAFCSTRIHLIRVDMSEFMEKHPWRG
jgi:ATP-dependent Clp protease ATP-binding subunit ClpA